MNTTKSNIQMYREVAEKIGLKTEFVQSTPSRKPLLISNDEKFFLINTKSPGFYPEARRWNAHFTQSKLLTQKILSRFGYTVIATEAVRIEQFTSAETLHKYLVDTHNTFPILIKPDRGYDGKGIVIVNDSLQFADIAKIHFENQTDFLLQPILDQTEYRVLVVNYEVELIHSKQNLHVLGDATTTIGELLAEVPEKKKDEVFIAWQHKKLGTTTQSVLQLNQKFDYHLTKIPTNAYYCTENFPPAVVAWATKLAKTISSPVVGIDVFIPGDISKTDTYTIIELNTNPAVYYLPTRCKDNVTGFRIIEKILRDFFNLHTNA